MKKISKSQAAKNRLVSKAKAGKPRFCIVCGLPCENGDGMHLMNKQIFPQYYTEPLNIWPGHRTCHNHFDNDKTYRGTCDKIINIVRQFATPEEISQYFGV